MIRRLKKRLPFMGIPFILAILAGLIISAGSTAGPKDIIYRITLDDDIINPPVAEYIESAIEKAKLDGARALIVELDTPGGLLSSTRTIVKAIMNSKVPVVTYIAPSGARAGSAGVFITLASHVAAMAPSTNIGAAHPVGLGGEKRESEETLSEALGKLFRGEDEKKSKKKKEKRKAPPMEQKLLSDTTAWMRAIANSRGRNESWAVKAVTESVSVTDGEALKLGIIDFIAKDIDELITKLNGRTVDVGGKTVTINTEGVKLVDYLKGFRLKFLTALAHPNIAYILLMLGFYGLLFEFTNPGIGFPGIAGAFCLVLAFFGLQVLPTNYAGIALIALAIAMFVAEVKVVSYGLLTLGGIVSMVAGSLILFRSPYAFMRVSIPLLGAFTVATLAIAIFLVSISARLQKRRSVSGAEGMRGERGEVQTWSGDHGKIFIHGEIWDAYGPKDLDEGAEVEVKSTTGMKLEVEKTEKKGSDW
jgi:membrane-bound serine protease (ClpP class)